MTFVFVVVVAAPQVEAVAFFFQILYETAPDAANQLAKPVVGDVPCAEKLAGGSHAGPPDVKIVPTKKSEKMPPHWLRIVTSMSSVVGRPVRFVGLEAFEISVHEAAPTARQRKM